MLKLKIFKNKKAAIEVSLIELLKIVLEVMVVLFLVYLTLHLSGLFTGKQGYDSTIKSLELLANKVKEPVNAAVGGEKKIATQTMVYGITDDYVLVGFSYDDKGTIRTECTNENILNSRPKSCQGKSCLCIYKNSGGKIFDDKKGVLPLRCKIFDEKIVFLGQSPDKNFKGAKTQWQPNHYPSATYNYLVAYGRCGSNLNLFAASWGAKTIYIEKYSEEDKLFVFIGDMSDKNVIERSNYFENKKNVK